MGAINGIRDMQRMMSSAAALVLVFAAGSAMAASFDCKKAASFAETSICQDGYLSSVDSSLGREYQKALANTGDPARLRQLQREWITERDQCTSQKCLDKTLGSRVTFLENYVTAERHAADKAEEQTRQDQRNAERHAEEIASAKRTADYNLAKEQSRLQREQEYLKQSKTAVASAAPVHPAPANLATAPQRSTAAQPLAEKPLFQRMWQTFWSGPAWKYALLIGFLISCWTVWLHHKETATIYNDYTDAAITNLLPAAGVIAALVMRWLELPGLIQVIAFTTGVLLGISYAVYATLRTNQGALNIALVIITKLTIITVFFAIIAMLVGSLFSNSGRRKGESQARTAARHRREAKQNMALIAALSVAYTTLTVWLCRSPEFTSIGDCLEFERNPAMA